MILEPYNSISELEWSDDIWINARRDAGEGTRERERERERERDFEVWYIALVHRQAQCVADGLVYFGSCQAIAYIWREKESEREREREREKNERDEITVLTTIIL